MPTRLVWRSLSIVSVSSSTVPSGVDQAAIFVQPEGAELVGVSLLRYSRTNTPEGALVYKVRMQDLHPNPSSTLTWKGQPAAAPSAPPQRGRPEQTEQAAGHAEQPDGVVALQPEPQRDQRTHQHSSLVARLAARVVVHAVDGDDDDVAELRRRRPDAEVIVETDKLSPEECAERIFDTIARLFGVD